MHLSNFLNICFKSEFKCYFSVYTWNMRPWKKEKADGKGQRMDDRTCRGSQPVTEVGRTGGKAGWRQTCGDKA